jgi:Neisseria PilC beta-propeller domain
MYLNKKKVFIPVLLAGGIFAFVAVFAAATFDPDVQPIGYVGQPVATNLSVVSGDEIMYTADYNSVGWSGNLHSYNLASNGTISTIDNWSTSTGGVGGAAEQISKQDFDTGRNIVTWDGTTGVAFRWSGTSSLTAAQKTSLDNATALSAPISPVLDYIRGDIARQADQNPPGPYRARPSVLGDIIHSTPVYLNDGTNRTVFVGANDGMLHAIDADDGTERFAYIPSMLIPRLSELKNPAYTHRYFVDGRMHIRKFGTQTILAGALGAGGRGLFGLDVTNAAVTTEAGAASKILWEITNTRTGYANLGYTYGAPTLLVLPDNTNALVVGNGYNNTGNGHASLFLINASTGNLIKEMDTGAGSSSSPNGLSTPSFVDTDGDGKKDIAYAGDIDGSLWKFNLASPYTVTKLHTTDPKQAITAAPSFVKHPAGGYMVTFVTGRMLKENDATNNDKHAAYGIWDGAPSDNSRLLEQTLTETNYTASTPSVRVRTATSIAPDWARHKGWRTELPIGGERLVGDGSMVKDGAPPVFLFMTSNPTIAADASYAPGTVPPGSNWWMQLSALTGGDSHAVQFDLNKDGAFNMADTVGATSPQMPVGRHMGGGVRSQLLALSARSNYVYQANFDKNGTAPPVTVGADPGVAGGHFDEDIYYGTSLTAGQPSSKLHKHEYDDAYDVTGVNMLNASNPGFNLINAIPLATTQFKVLAQNQYLNPAVKIHLHGSPSYVFNIDQGYTPIKNFITSATLDLTDNTKVPTYSRSDILSLAINMPVDAFQIRDWWGGAPGGATGSPLPADLRVGLHPTQTGCVKSAKNSTDGNMYQPVNPPNGVTADGNGTLGYSASTTAITATGVRHNGALVIQIIKAATPNSAIEMSVPNRPEYGWRVKSAEVKNWVLAEYTTFWHEKVNGKCYGQAGWTKAPVVDTRICGTSDTATTKKCGSVLASTTGDDPHIGGLGSVVTYTQGNVTTTTTRMPDGSIKIDTVTTNPNGTTTTTTRTITQGVDTGGGINNRGEVDPGGEKGIPPNKGRINWRELLQ